MEVVGRLPAVRVGRPWFRQLTRLVHRCYKDPNDDRRHPDPAGSRTSSPHHKGQRQQARLQTLPLLSFRTLGQRRL